MTAARLPPAESPPTATLLASMPKAAALSKTGVQARVIDMHTVKPLDEEAIVKAATETGRIVVTEEHLMAGGLGSAVASVVARTKPVPMT